jgi:hypothetical protein
LCTAGLALAGARVSSWLSDKPGHWGKLTEAQEGYVVGTVYTLLGLLIGFTFAMAVERFETRRQLVVEDADSIEQLYLRAQLLDEPHRSRFSNLLVRYTQNHIQLAQTHRDNAAASKLIAEDQQLLRDLWTATVPAFQSIRTIDFSSSFVDSVNQVVKADADRKAARRAQIPSTVIAMLILYSLIAAALLGAVMRGRKGEVASIIMLALSVLALMLIVDINRPVSGTIHESQEPMKRMLMRLQANPPAVYQRLALPAP